MLTEDNTPPPPPPPHITLPYKGSKGLAVINSFMKCLSENLPENVITRFIFKGKNLGHFFLLWTKSVLSICLGLFMVEDNVFRYVGLTKVRHETRTYQHDKNSAVYRHSHEQNYTVDPSNFTILAKGYPFLD